jgi:GT2 family glycosyltransferase
MRNNANKMDVETSDPRSDGFKMVKRDQADARFTRLAEELAQQVERLEADLAAERAERKLLGAALKKAHVATIVSEVGQWQSDLSRSQIAERLEHAEAHIARMQRLLRGMRERLGSMELSRFWKLRNCFFTLKKLFGLDQGGAIPSFAVPVDISEYEKTEDPYFLWQQENDLRRADIARLRDAAAVLAYRPLISVVMPTYNAPELYLRQAIESVITQVYENWELCIADDASTQPHVRAVLEEYVRADSRIKVDFRNTNGHIAHASNSALALASGEFIALFDHDDLLTPDALYENVRLLNAHPDADMIYSDEDKIDDKGHRSNPYFKPDWSPDSFLSRNYVSHLGVYRLSLVVDLDGFRPGFEGSQDYDLVLRIVERTHRIHHIPRVLYHWRIHAASVASGVTVKNYAYEAAMRAIAEAMHRRGEPGRVEMLPNDPGNYTVRYDLKRDWKVSIIIPTRDHADDLERCLSSIFAKSTYRNFEVVVLDNGSVERETVECFAKWRGMEPERVKVVPHNVPFNYSEINNYAVRQSSGDVVLLLNNDTEVIMPDWIEAMLEQAQRPTIGCVGAKLLYEDGTIQHAGVVMRIGGVAGHSHRFYDGDEPGYFHVVRTVNNYSAVTAACLMIRRELWDRVGGLEEQLTVAFNDIDFCLRIRDAGFYNVYVPHATLYHYESKSRGFDDTPAKIARSISEQQFMQARWNVAQVDDPFYSPHLSLTSENYAIRL